MIHVKIKTTISQQKHKNDIHVNDVIKGQQENLDLRLQMTHDALTRKIENFGDRSTKIRNVTLYRHLHIHQQQFCNRSIPHHVANPSTEACGSLRMNLS